jgi:K+-transporting ATPase KdpF subunit
LRCSRWPSKAASGCEDVMLVDFVVAGVVALLLLGYLAYALIRPEKF